MKKRFFSPSLYLEFLRQLLLPGLIFTVIMNLEAAINLITSVISEHLASELVDYEPSVNVLTFLDIHPIAAFSMVLVAPVLIFCALKWVNSRKSSDFYHSLCETRECVFLSAFAAAVSWFLIALISSSVVAVVGTLMFPQYFFLNIASVFYNLLAITAASLFIMAAISIAISVTGTYFNNIIVSFIATFFPQALFFAIRVAVISNSPIMTHYGIFGQSYNIPFALIESVFNIGDVEHVMGSIPHAIYTLVMAVIYLVIATALFKIRKSEFAGNSAVGKNVQGLFRVLVGTTASLIPLTMLFNEIINMLYGYGLDTDADIAIVILYVLMVVAVGVYELIATKKFRNLINAAISLIPIAIINLALLGTMFGVYYVGILFKPDADDIKSVQIIQAGDYYEDLPEYFASVSSDINVTSVEAKEIVSAALKSSIANQYNYEYSETYESFTVVINTWSGKRYRNIKFTEKQYQALIAELESNNQYRQLYSSLPEVNDGAISIWFSGNNENIDAAKLYNLMRDDISKMKFADSYRYLNSIDYKSGTVAGLSVTVPHGTKNYTMEIPVTEELPSAFNYIMEANYKRTLPLIDTIADYAAEYTEGIDGNYNGNYFDVCFYNLVNADGSSFTDPVYAHNVDFTKLAEFIRNSKDKVATAGQPMISVECSIAKPVETEWGTDYEYILDEKIYIPLDSNQLPDFYIPGNYYEDNAYYDSKD